MNFIQESEGFFQTPVYFAKVVHLSVEFERILKSLVNMKVWVTIMFKKYLKKFLSLSSFILIIFLLHCSGFDDVDVEVDPGILRVILQTDPTDESIVILGETINVSENDSLGINIFQGKAIDVDSNYAILYKTVHHWTQGQYIYNVLKREAGEYKKQVIFESLVPPGKYRGISLGIEGTVMAIGSYRIPTELPPGAESIMVFEYDYEVSERKVTEIYIQISPFKSMSRYLDSYQFSRIVEITGIKYLSEDDFDKTVAGLPYLINPNNPFGG